MKESATFVFAVTASACLCFAGRWVIGSGESEVRPLARSRGTAMINECCVTGRIESRSNGVYAVFDFVNPTPVEKEIKFNYLAMRTPPMSMMSRMVPRPETVKKGAVACRVKAGDTTEEVLLKEPVLVIPDSAKGEDRPGTSPTGVAARLELALTPEIWSLVISREEIKGIHGWGAVGPATSDAIFSLEKGEAVLAHTVLEKTIR